MSTSELTFSDTLSGEKIHLSFYGGPWNELASLQIASEFSFKAAPTGDFPVMDCIIVLIVLTVKLS